MPGLLLPKLVDRYGRGRVVDVFQDTGMEPHAQELGLGGYVVRGVLPPEQCAHWHETLEKSLAGIALEKGSRSVELKGQGSSVVPHDPVHKWVLYMQVWLRGHCQEPGVQDRTH